MGHHAWADIKKDKWDIARERDALRALLAPLLDNPLETDDVADWCLFCHVLVGAGLDVVHEPGCAVLRKDELLGREQ